MKQVIITIKTENAAFDESPEFEIARILRNIADQFENQSHPFEKVYDVNGNCCGSVRVKE